MTTTSANVSPPAQTAADFNAAMDRIRDELAKNKRDSVNTLGEIMTKLLQRFPEIAGEKTDLSELREAVDKLPEKLRLPFLLVYMEGYSAQEAASVTGITLFALKSRLKRAKKALQIELTEEEA